MDGVFACAAAHKKMKALALLCVLFCTLPVCSQNSAVTGEGAKEETVSLVTVNMETLPEVYNLNSKDESFAQYCDAVEDSNKERASGKALDFLMFKYEVKKDDTLRAIAARCCIRVETIATINSISSIDDTISGRTLILPAFNAVFIALEPQNAFETLIAHDTSFEEYVAKSKNLCYNVNGRLFMTADGAKISPTERLFFYDASYSMPVEGAYLSSKYGMRTSPISGKRKFHSGIDLAVAEGTAVHPCKSGTVMECKNGDKVFGNYVVIEHKNGVTSLYAHLKQILTSKGAAVGTASIIGKVGHTGMATGPHLHFEIKTQGKSIDPNQVLGG